MKHATLIYGVLCCLCSFAVADNSYGQKILDQNITVSLVDVPLGDALKEIADDAGIEFAYTHNTLKNSALITLQVREEKLRAVLKELLVQNNLTYAIVDDIIVLKREDSNVFMSETSAFQVMETVSGRIVGKDGQPIPGVNVIEKGTTNGTSTDGNGMYRITVSDQNAILVFSFIGYATQEVPLGGQTSIDVTLNPDTRTLDEVVVVGYGTQEKVNITGSVSVISGDQLVDRQVASTSAALQGLSPGVMVTQQSGLPGADAGRIRIRGVSSMFAGQNPLVLVDNVEMSLNAVDVNNIESISILKDAAAASIYGSRAANGVILITTKRGSARKGASIRYHGYVGVQEATNMPEKVNALDHMKMYDQALQNVDRQPVFTTAITDYEQFGPDNFSRFNTDWKDLMLTNDGLIRNHHLSLSAGSDKVAIYASGSALKQHGLTANTTLERLDFRVNADVEVLKNLTASMDLVMNKSDRTWPYISPTTLMMYTIGLPAYVAGQFDNGEYGEGWNDYNPLAMAEAGGFDNDVTMSNVLTGTITYKPHGNLEMLAFYSSNNRRTRSRSMSKQYMVYRPDLVNNTLVPGALYPATNGLTETWLESVQNMFRSQATYSRNFGNHRLKILGGVSAEDFQLRSIAGERTNFINPDQPYLNVGDAGTMINSGGINEWAIFSLYGRINYEFNHRYLLELNGRADASSRFAEENRWGYFPSLSAGWRISEESFWSGGLKRFIDDAKVRLSYGVLGNQNLSSYYPTVSQFATGETYNYFFDYGLTSGYALTQASNPGIRWESSRQFDIGVDLSLLNSRLTLTADYFRRDIYDMLQTLPIPMAVGLAAPYVNAGSMRNTGWELSLGWRDEMDDFQYGVRFNLSDLKNEVIDLNDQEYITGNNIIREGHPINSYFGYASDGLFQSQQEIDDSPTHYPNTKPGDIKYIDMSGADGVPDGLIDNYDRVVLGNAFPRYEYTLNLDAAWKGFDIAMFLHGVGKRDNYLSNYGAWPFYATSFAGTAYEYHKDSWTPDNPDAVFPRLTVGINNNQHHSDYWIRSGAYLRVKSVVLGYTLPSAVNERLKIGSVRFYVSGQNLLTFDGFFDGFDPEREDNTGQFYPIMKTLSAGVNFQIQ